MTNRPEQAHDPLEEKIQKQIVQWCYDNLHPDVDFWCTNNNSVNGWVGERNKKMGVKPGVSDLTFCWSRHAYMEVKRPGKGLSNEQADFFGRMEERGHITGILTSVDDMIAFADKYNIPRQQRVEISEQDWEGMGL